MSCPAKVEICLKCGVQGIKEAMIYCLKCKLNAEHYYCLDKLPKTFDLKVNWFCHECELKTSLVPSAVNEMSLRKRSSNEKYSSGTAQKRRKPNSGETSKCLDELTFIKSGVRTDGTSDINESPCHTKATGDAVQRVQIVTDVKNNGVVSGKETERKTQTDSPVPVIIPVDSESDSDFTGNESLNHDSDTDDGSIDKVKSIKITKARECDIAWEHAVKIQKPKLGLVCKYCARAMTGRGRITRLKEHLAGGYDSKTIKSCSKVPLEVKETMKKLLDDRDREKAMIVATAQMNGKEITDFSNRGKVRKDAAWDYADRVDGKKNAMVCKFCSQFISGGGITRFKRHLSKKCTKAPSEVREAMNKVLITKDIVRAKLDATVDQIRKEMGEDEEQGVCLGMDVLDANV